MATLDTPIPAKYTECLGSIVDFAEINIFNFDYNLYVKMAENATPEERAQAEAEAKEALQRDFIERYYFDEIGFETYGRFISRLKETWLHNIAWLNTMRQAYAELTNEDAFTSDNFESSSLSIFNNAPKGVVNFDDNHANAYNRSSGKNKGLAGKTKWKAAKKRSFKFTKSAIYLC